MGLYEIVLGLIIVIASIAAFFCLSVFNNYQKVKHIPGSWQFFVTLKKRFLISPFFYFGSHQAIKKLTEESGDEQKTVRIAMYDRNIVSISDKDHLKEVLVSKGGVFTKSAKLYQVFNTFGENILSALDSSDESWKKHHKVCAPAFSSKNLEYMTTVASNSMDLIRSTKWDKEIEQAKKRGERGIVFDANADFSDVTLDVLGKAGFGIDLAIFDDKNPAGRLFRRSLEKMFTIVSCFCG